MKKVLQGWGERRRWGAEHKWGTGQATAQPFSPFTGERSMWGYSKEVWVWWKEDGHFSSNKPSFLSDVKPDHEQRVEGPGC